MIERVPFLGRLRLIEKWLPVGAVRVLEVGCAWGYLVSSLRHNANERYGLDVNHLDIFDAQARFGVQARFMCAAAENLPLPAASFDAVIMSEVLEHTASESDAVTEAARVLRPGGTLITTVPHRGPMELTDLTNWKFRLPFLHHLAYGWKHRGDFSRFNPVRQYHRHYTLRRLRELMEPYFEITAVRRGGFVLFALADYAALVRSRAVAAFLGRIASADYGVDYGLLSYNLAVQSRKR